MSLQIIEEDGFLIENNNKEISEYQKSMILNILINYILIIS